jgi:hypothetical protein
MVIILAYLHLLLRRIFTSRSVLKYRDVATFCRALQLVGDFCGDCTCTSSCTSCKETGQRCRDGCSSS